MVITKTSPYTKREIEKLREEFKDYVKTVIDIERKICSAGCNRHFEGEQILIGKGSRQSDIWGGGIDIKTKEIDFNSFINIRPSQNNPSNDILDPKIREEYDKLTRYFFSEIL